MISLTEIYRILLGDVTLPLSQLWRKGKYLFWSIAFARSDLTIFFFLLFSSIVFVSYVNNFCFVFYLFIFLVWFGRLEYLPDFSNISQDRKEKRNRKNRLKNWQHFECKKIEWMFFVVVGWLCFFFCEAITCTTIVGTSSNTIKMMTRVSYCGYVMKSTPLLHFVLFCHLFL